MGIKLLLADDSITIQKVVGIIFASDEYDLSIVDNGTAALVKAKAAKPDVLLVDAVMPGMSGYEVCEEIRRDPELQGVPILLLTGAFEPFDEEKARKSGADDYISKPFESQSLIDKVAALISLGRERSSAAPVQAPALSPPSGQSSAAMQSVSPSSEAAAVASPSLAAAPVSTVAVTSAPEFAVEVVEGTADDDLWGAFDLEEVSETDGGDASSDLFAVEEESLVTEAVEDETFVTETVEDEAFFTEAVEEDPFAFAEEATVAEPVATTAPQFDSAGEDSFSFAEDAGGFDIMSGDDGLGGVFEENVDIFESLPDEGAAFMEEDAVTVFAEPPADPQDIFAEIAEPAAFGSSPVAAVPDARQELDLQFAPDEEYVPFETGVAFGEAPPVAALSPVVAPVASVTAPADAAGMTLTEEQLTSLVSKISRDILEKIAWEVVPDLAERIIRDEIRKIKEGV